MEVASILVALQAKGVSGSELAAFATQMIEVSVALPATFEDLVDTCGTGGGIPSFNLSTAAAVVATAAGAKVAKHGNRAVTSSCGSADVLEELGVKINLTPEESANLLREVGIAFLFAPTYHPAMRFVGPVRRALGVRTVFNQLGPLANPAGAKRQVIGVYDPKFMQPMAEALQILGSKLAYIVRSEDGLDEVSPCGVTHAIRIQNGELANVQWTPQSFGIDPVSTESLAPGKDLAESAHLIQDAVSNIASPRSLAIVPTAAVALMAGGIVSSPEEAGEQVKEAIRSGRARTVLDKWIEVSNR